VSPLNSRAPLAPRSRRNSRRNSSPSSTDRTDLDPSSSSSSSSTSSSSSSKPLPRSLSFRVAAPGADLRAAASLRALAFSTNLPETASGFTREAYVRNRSREAWDALELRSRGLDPDYGGCECLCLLGTIEDAGNEEEEEEEEPEENELEEEELELARAVRAEGDASCTLAAVSSDRGRGRENNRRRRLAVASLDIIVGPRLPSEALVAKGGGGGDGGGDGEGATTAYFANVSVAPAARRRGLGVALLSEAISLVSSSPLGKTPAPRAASRIAVHAEARNAAARALYEQPELGFSLEQEESAEVERAQGRPRRVLYSRGVVAL